MKRLLMVLFSINPVVKPSKYSVKEIFNLIENAKTYAEIFELEEQIDFLAREGDFSEEEHFQLIKRITYSFVVMNHMVDHFTHDYYPPFSIKAHIQYATEQIQLDAVRMHLNFNIKAYLYHGCSREQLMEYYRMIDQYGCPEKGLTKSQYYDKSK